jgi:hypothetical protein
MPRTLLFLLILASLSTLTSCQTKSTDSPPGVTQAEVPLAPPNVAQPKSSVIGTYRRIEDYPEKGFVTADYADGRRGLGFVSTPAPHEEVHEWGGSLEGDTLMVQTYGNAMNEYENFVGGCSCKFLTLIKQH